MHIDRHIAIWTAFIAGPAFGVAMTVAPFYFNLQPSLSARLFWGGIWVYVSTAVVLLALSIYKDKRWPKVFGAIIVLVLLMLASVAPWYFQGPGVETEYSILSNFELRARVTSHAADLRNFEKEYKDLNSAIRNSNRNLIGKSDADRNRVWSEERQQIEVLSNQERAEFHNGFLSTSKYLHYELLKRLGLSPPTMQAVNDLAHYNAILVLDTGFIAGPQPIHDLADYLEDLARRLP